MQDTDTEHLPAHRIKTVHIDDRRLTARLRDGRTLMVPLSFYPALRGARRSDRENCRVFGDGFGIEWPALDYHLSAEGLMHGRREGRWYPAWRKQHPIGSELVIDEGTYFPKASHRTPTAKRPARRKSAARKPSSTRRTTKHR